MPAVKHPFSLSSVRLSPPIEKKKMPRSGKKGRGGIFLMSDNRTVCPMPEHKEKTPPKIFLWSF